jgi:hypothetical protein
VARLIPQISGSGKEKTPKPLKKKKNRAKWPEGDQEARGIFEFSTPVGLGDFRKWLYNTHNRNLTGK